MNTSSSSHRTGDLHTLRIYEELNVVSPLTSSCLEELVWSYQMSGQHIKCLELCYRQLAIEESHLPEQSLTLSNILKDIMELSKTPDDYRSFFDFCRQKLLVLGTVLDSEIIHVSTSCVSVWKECKRNWRNSRKNTQSYRCSPHRMAIDAMLTSSAVHIPK